MRRFIVVGGGPVGLVAALALARQGHAVTVLEADADICDGSRAICISRRSLQVLARLGVARRFLDKGLHWTEGRSYLGTTEIFHLRMPYGEEDRFPPFVNLQQFYAETFLREACENTGLVDIRWGHRVMELDARPDGVDLTVEAAGSVSTFGADWVIAADGGRSTVREQGLGLTLEGRSYESRYLIADIALTCDWPTERKVWFDPASNPGSTVIMHRQPDDVWRIDYQLRAQEDGEEALRDDNVKQRIAAHLAMVGLSGPWRLLWKSLYRAHTLSLRDYVHGRIAFAGDAAHLVPIFGVRGLNSGIDDAANLAWKLSLVARGLASAALLASYTQERRAAYLENIENAAKSTWFMSPPSDGFVVARDAVLELATRHTQFRVLIDPRQSSAHLYRSCAIDADAQGPWIGLPLPEARLSDGGSLHDLLGSGFGAILCTDAATARGIEERAVHGLDVRLLHIPSDDTAAARLAMKPGDLLLVRPDGYVAGVSRNVDDAAVDEALHHMLTRAGLPQREGHHADIA
jgi:3-(3-hydroxy-phenyl)propionate hydroxylase